MDLLDPIPLSENKQLIIMSPAAQAPAGGDFFSRLAAGIAGSLILSILGFFMSYGTDIMRWYLRWGKGDQVVVASEIPKGAPTPFDKMKVLLENTKEKAERAIVKAKEPMKEAVVKAEHKVEAVKEEAREKFEELKDTRSNFIEQRQVAHDEFIRKHEEANKAREEQQAKAKAEHDRLLDLWRKVGQNGRCVNCSHPMKVSTSRRQTYLCPKCGNRASSNAIRNMGAPPMPRDFRG